MAWQIIKLILNVRINIHEDLSNKDLEYDIAASLRDGLGCPEGVDIEAAIQSRLLVEEESDLPSDNYGADGSDGW